MFRSRANAASALATVAALTLSSAARAGSDSHYQDTLIGERASAMGGAFTALGDEATGAFYNPAGIVVGGSTMIQLSMSAFKLRQKRVEVLDFCGRSVEDDASAFFSFPAALGFVKLLSTGSVRHAVGLTLAVPTADRQSQAVVLDDVDCGTFSVDIGAGTAVVDRVFSGGLTYAIQPVRWLQLGATVGLTTRAVSGTGLTSLVVEEAGATSNPTLEFLNVDATIWSLFFQLGARVEVAPGLLLGASLTSPLLKIDGSGRLDLAYASGVGEDDVAGAAGVVPSDDVEYEWKVPLRLALGVAYRRPGRFVLAVDVTFHPPVDRHLMIVDSDLLLGEDAPVTEREAVVNVSVGAEVSLGKKLALRGGFFTNLSAFPADLEANLFSEDIDYFGATLGASYASTETSSLSLSLQGQVGQGTVELSRITATGDPDDPFAESAEPRDVTALSLIIFIGGNFDLR